MTLQYPDLDLWPPELWHHRFCYVIWFVYFGKAAPQKPAHFLHTFWLNDYRVPGIVLGTT